MQYNQETELRLTDIERLAYLVETGLHTRALVVAEVLSSKNASVLFPEAFSAWRRRACLRLRSITIPPVATDRSARIAHLDSLCKIFNIFGDSQARLACWKELIDLRPPNIEDLFSFCQCCIAAGLQVKAELALEMSLTRFTGTQRERITSFLTWLSTPNPVSSQPAQVIRASVESEKDNLGERDPKKPRMSPREDVEMSKFMAED